MSQTIPRKLIVGPPRDPRKPAEGMVTAEGIGSDVWVSNSYWLTRNPSLPDSLKIDLSSVGEGERVAWSVNLTGPAHSRRDGANLDSIRATAEGATVRLERAIAPDVGGLLMVQSGRNVCDVFTDGAKTFYSVNHDYRLAVEAQCDDPRLPNDLAWFGHKGNNLRPIVLRRCTRSYRRTDPPVEHWTTEAILMPVRVG